MKDKNECWCDPNTHGANPNCPTHGDYNATSKSSRLCSDCRWCGPARPSEKILCNHESWAHWDEEMRVFAPAFADECNSYERHVNPHIGSGFCGVCYGAGMIPSDDPNGDVMNTRCPKCNSNKSNTAKNVHKTIHPDS